MKLYPIIAFEFILQLPENIKGSFFILLLSMLSACGQDVGTASGSAKTDNALTFSRHIAGIFYRHCADCHRPNGIAPFSVLTYNDVRPWLQTIREKVAVREMPPWHADPRFGEFINDARLQQEEIDMIVSWIEQGAAEGSREDLPPLPAVVPEWKIGVPDKIFTMSEDFVIQPGSPDSYVYYTIPTRFKEDTWIQAAEIHPGNFRVVHHVIAHVLSPRAMAKAKQGGGGETTDAEQIFYRQGTLARVKIDAPVIDDGASAANGGASFKRHSGDEDIDGFSMLLASYAPGKAPDVFPDGMAKKIPAGSVIVLQLHYSSFRGLLGTPEKDRSSLGLVFAKKPPAKRVMTLTVPNHYFNIPPGAENHEVTAAYVFDKDVELINFMPHMHLRGKDMRYEAVYPDSKRETLLAVPAFNFNWQTIYLLKKPLPIPKGTRLIVTAHFDNSTRNKYNPDASATVRWGDPTEDEMMVGWLDYAQPETMQEFR